MNQGSLLRRPSHLPRALALPLIVVALSCRGGHSTPADPVTPHVDPFTERAVPADLAGEVARVVDANSRFAFDIYRVVRETPGNLFLSPYSISTAFAMVYAGARGETEAEIARVFHFDALQDSLHAAFGALQGSLDRGVNLGGYEVRVANRLWGQNGQPFRQPFLDVTREDYGAEMEVVDFARDPESVRAHINGWVLDRTAGRIEDLFPPRSITESTRLVLANAIYFKGKWQHPFDPADTHASEFTLSSGQRVPVPTMHMLDTLALAQPNGLSVLALPYGGGDLDMLLLLPASADGLEALEASLSLESLDDWSWRLATTPVEVALPRFGFTSEFSLIDPLSRMGMPVAFGGDADFTGIRETGGLGITGAMHKAFVQVNEEGTEAAAATGVVVGETSAPVWPRFIADHPFLFLIRDRVTGSLLFLGRVADPRG
jgi:serpin B